MAGARIVEAQGCWEHIHQAQGSCGCHTWRKQWQHTVGAGTRSMEGPVRRHGDYCSGQRTATRSWGMDRGHSAALGCSIRTHRSGRRWQTPLMRHSVGCGRWSGRRCNHACIGIDRVTSVMDWRWGEGAALRRCWMPTSSLSGCASGRTTTSSWHVEPRQDLTRRSLLEVLMPMYCILTRSPAGHRWDCGWACIHDSELC